jgi:arylsulfatase A-like enzyme
VWLQASGYYTAHIGKYLNGYGQLDTNPADTVPARLEIPPGYSEWYGLVDPMTYNYYGYMMNENGHLVTYGNAPADYQTDVLSGRATDFIRRRAIATDGTPFFLVIAPLAPHHDSVPPVSPEPAPRHQGYFSSEPLPTPPSLNEADMSDKPAFMQLLPLMGDGRIADITTCYRKRLETLLAVDDMVGDVVDTLSATGQLGNTIIIFTSDNGWLQGEHRIPYGKEFAYEPSIRVPLILRGPGIPQGKRVTNLVANIDLAPTIVEATGAVPGRVMDGISLMRLLRGDTTRNGILVECRGLGPTGDAEGGLAPENSMVSLDFNAVRTKDYTYVSYASSLQLKNGRAYTFSGGEELYDLARDPFELQSVSSDPRYRTIKAGLKSRLGVLETCSGTGCW